MEYLQTDTYGFSETKAGSDSPPIQYVSLVPEPGAVCPTCHEKTPNKHALEMRAWRKKRKSETHGTEEKP